MGNCDSLFFDGCLFCRACSLMGSSLCTVVYVVNTSILICIKSYRKYLVAYIMTFLLFVGCFKKAKPLYIYVYIRFGFLWLFTDVIHFFVTGLLVISAIALTLWLFFYVTLQVVITLLKVNLVFCVYVCSGVSTVVGKSGLLGELGKCCVSNAIAPCLGTTIPSRYVVLPSRLLDVHMNSRF